MADRLQLAVDAILSCNQTPGPKLTRIMAERRARAVLDVLDRCGAEDLHERLRFTDREPGCSGRG